MTTAASIPIIDTDAHIIEPEDLWTARVSKKWGDDVPHVAPGPNGYDRWFVGGNISMPAGMLASVGFSEIFPEHPRTLADADPGTYDPHARLERLDENGIHAQLIYPNLVGFFAHTFMKLDPGLGLECTRAYNDFLSEWCSADPQRLIPLMALPFWDLEASVAEMERCKAQGHKGILFAHTFETLGLPNLPDPHWTPILDAAQSLELPVNFHTAFAAASEDRVKDLFADQLSVPRAEIAAQSANTMMSNSRAIMMLTMHGVCERFPHLNFVSVESGVGWIPFLLQALDWQWKNNCLSEERPGWLLPSEYFRRQICATMWFEKPPVETVIEFQDNIMFETDYPHPTAQWPTPTTDAPLPGPQAVKASFDGVPSDVVAKVVNGNATRIYHLDS